MQIDPILQFHTWLSPTLATNIRRSLDRKSHRIAYNPEVKRHDMTDDAQSDGINQTLPLILSIKTYK